MHCTAIRRFALCLGLWSSIMVAHAADLSVSNGWVRALPPTQPNTAAFLTLKNTSQQSITLVSVVSDAAKKSEFHSHKKQASGMMAMRQEKSISIAAGQEFVFQPGSYHIMLMGLNSPLKAGDTVKLVLIEESGAEHKVELPVKSPMDENSHKHHHHH